jgi:hypothetical protein
MPEIGMSISMSGDGKRGDAAWPKLPRPSSTLPELPVRGVCSRREPIEPSHEPNIKNWPASVGLGAPWRAWLSPRGMLEDGREALEQARTSSWRSARRRMGRSKG